MTTQNPADLPKPVAGEHPGVHLQQLLEIRGWSQSDLAFVLGVPVKSINPITSEKRGISGEMSRMLGAALGLPEGYFAELQAQYDVAHADAPDPSISLMGRMRNVEYPIREMIKRGWILETDPTDPNGRKLTAAELEKQIARFFEVQGPDEIPYLVHSAKKTGSYEQKKIPTAQLAWLFRVKQIAKAIPIPSYSPESLKEAVGRMRPLLVSPAETRQVPKIMNACGVRFIMVEPIPGSKIDGVAFWLNNSSPVIGLSSRFDRIDNFWFVLRHEIEHILQGHGKVDPMIDAELEIERADLPDEERVANKAAADFCVPSDKMESFIRRKQPFFYERDVLAFSQINGVHPGLVVGQIQYRTRRWGYLKHYQVKVRQFVVPGSMADGWGQTVPIETEATS